jgi:NAD(P)-dependent dehydrogenase (short-subunit alcohol dehydrogenase family)
MLEDGNHRIEPFDLSQTDELPAWLKVLAGECGPIHGVVHCAGAELLLPLQVQKSSQIENLLRINVVSAIMLAKAFRQKGVHDTPASLVFISSVMGMVGEAGRSAYCASKGALHALTKSLALELAKDEIRVNCIAPGAVETEMSRQAASKLGEERAQLVQQLHPLGTGDPLDVANAAAYLLADTARWTTGSILTVDGGYTSH